jgi:hypothetical protein
MLLSFTTTPTSIQIIDENTNNIYDVEYDFSIPVKSFIHGIKNLLIENGCYPTMEKVEKSKEDVGKEEQLKMAVEGTPLESIPVQRYKKHVKTFRLEKLIVYKDIFIIRDLEEDKLFRYKLKSSSVFFLKKMRSGKINLEQAAEFFFSNAELLGEVLNKEE